MHFSDLPDSEFLGYAADPESLAGLLDQAIAGSPGPFEHFDRAVGGPRSCRILFQKPIIPYTETVPLNRPHSSTAAAWQFFREDFIPQVRFDPPNAPSSDARKGWEVRKAIHLEKPFVVILAAWVKEPQAA